MLYLKHEKNEKYEELSEILKEIQIYPQRFLPLHIVHVPYSLSSTLFQHKTLNSNNIVNMYSFIKNNGALSELLARFVIRQIIHVLNECKQNHVFPKIISRSDIYINTSNLFIKVIIPQVNVPYESQPTSTLPCSTYYLPPEWLKHKQYNIDSFLTWNIGLLLFFMLYNRMPFLSRWEIMYCPVILHRQKLLDANLFIGWCLAKKIKKRITLKECQHHPWITQTYI